MEAYIGLVNVEIYHSLDRGPLHRSNDNITNLERKVLSSLQTKLDIIIKLADKGSATVVMTMDDYLKQIMDHLKKHPFV